MTTAEIETTRTRLSHWRLGERVGSIGSEGKQVGLTRTYKFMTFEDAMHFMHTASRVFSKAQHHPEWENRWISVRVWLTSWDIGHRPSQKDVALAEELDRLYRHYEVDH